MSAAGGLGLPTPSNASSPKDIPNMSPTSIASLAGVPRVPSMPNDLSIATGQPPAAPYLPPQLPGNMGPGMIDPRILYSALVSVTRLKLYCSLIACITLLFISIFIFIFINIGNITLAYIDVNIN